MFDNNYDEKGGVSIWGHVLDGAATGAMGGALFGGIGAIPGAIGGGAVGLVNGLLESHEDSEREDTWMKANHDDATLDRAMERLPSNGKMPSDEAIKEAAQGVYRQDRAAQKAAEPSWFDDMF